MDVVTAVEFLDGLDAARAKATPGLWKLWGMDVLADQDGTSNVDTAVRVAHTCYRDEHGKPRTFDAELICQMQRALPKLTAALRAVEALADELEVPVGTSSPFGGLSGRIRAVVADALGAS